MRLVRKSCHHTNASLRDGNSTATRPRVGPRAIAPLLFESNKAGARTGRRRNSYFRGLKLTSTSEFTLTGWPPLSVGLYRN
jgi:hypothetical protein